MPPSPTLPTSPPSTSTSLSHLKSYHLTIEYRHLKSHSPSGVYLLPSQELSPPSQSQSGTQTETERDSDSDVGSATTFNGVIFIRRGIYCNGIFRFILTTPAGYNEDGKPPVIIFSSVSVSDGSSSGESEKAVYPYSPLINPITGHFQLSYFLPEWKKDKHYLITALTYLKRCFYIKPNLPSPSLRISSEFVNREAGVLYNSKKKEDGEVYERRVNECVTLSQETVYSSSGGANSSTADADASGGGGIVFHAEGGSKHKVLMSLIVSDYTNNAGANDSDKSGSTTKAGASIPVDSSNGGGSRDQVERERFEVAALPKIESVLDFVRRVEGVEG